MRVKLFSQAANVAIQILENEINDFLEAEEPHVRHVTVTSSDLERVASVWYDEARHRTMEQTLTELEELAEDPSTA